MRCNNVLFTNQNYKPMKRILTMLLLLTGMWCTSIWSQQAVASGGGEGSGSGGTVSYTVGQVAYASAGDESVTVSAGVQHAYEVYVISGSRDLPGIAVSVYPNPSVDKVTLNLGEKPKALLSYQLIDAGGNMLEEKEITDQLTGISLGRLPAAGYLLRIMQSGKEINVFKIIKKQ